MAFPVDDYEVRWKNYKSFVDTGWIKIRPLTIIIGTNNSGKSSVITPLLLMAQTLSSLDGVTALVTRGPLANVGRFKDYIHNHKTSDSLFFGFRFHMHVEDTNQKKLKDSSIGRHPPGAIEVTLAKGNSNEADVKLQQIDFFDVYNRKLWTQKRLKNGEYSLTGKGIKKLTNKKEVRALKETSPMNFLFSPAATLRKYEYLSGDKFSDKQLSKGFSQYLGLTSFAVEELRDVFYSLTYIGPLRERLRRYYEISGEMPRAVGTQGEHMANLIRLRYRNNKKLNTWIKRFGFGNKITVKDSSDVFSLFFKNEDATNEINIADAGFGASQVLPLIVQALAARKRELIIAEQPEIHLNPRLQSELADLFVDLANEEKRIIVETHSEHMLLRLRRLIAEGEIDHNNVAIYFVEKQKDIATIRPISVEKNGHISPDEWPKGFFADSLRESLALATAQSKAEKTSKLKSSNSRKASKMKKREKRNA